MSAPGQMAMDTPINIEVQNMSFSTANGYNFSYHMPNPVKQCMCCFMPCGGGDDFADGFFMEFAEPAQGNRIKFKEHKHKCCELDANFVSVYHNDEKIGHLEKPFSCFEKCCGCCQECCSDSILLMSFRKAAEGGDEEEVYTIRRKAAGCCGGCTSCCMCCGCKGCGVGKCCGSSEISTTLNEAFAIYGNMEEEMADPVGTFVLSYRRGLMMGPTWTPVSAQLNTKEPLKDGHEGMLLLAFAYGILYQSVQSPGSFPAMMGAQWTSRGQGVARGTDAEEEIPEGLFEGHNPSSTE